jgi:FixJ family two-component response regulator
MCIIDWHLLRWFVVNPAKTLNARIVYILDDDDSVRNGFSRLLRSAHFEVRAYGASDEFIEDIRNVSQGCILMDLTMPQMTGCQVMAALKRKGIHMPMIALSASDTDESRRDAKERGAVMYLRKPVDDRALLDAINWATGNGMPSSS